MIAAVYVRKSNDQTAIADDQKSVARQLEHARVFAASKGWTVLDAYEYVDDGISGAEFQNRPGFLRLMNALKPRAPFQVLIMSEVSRLGREQIETAYALKQLSLAGVRCFSYLDGRELLMESATDKFLMGAVTFAADLEREKARQRTYDAMIRKAKSGHVTGGRRFGYDNVEVLDPTGKRSHVEYGINPAEAEVVRRIFQLRAEGMGLSRIAKQLNAERAATPRSQQGRPRAWSPSSVREILFRDLYRGVITWNRSRKRNSWGQQQQSDRPIGKWLQVPAPQLRIVSEEVWCAAHERLATARAAYERDTHGQRRKHRDEDSKYLLPSFGRCALCGGGLHVRSRSHGAKRKFFYACTAHFNCGPEVCPHADQWPMEDIDGELLATIGERLTSATEELITEARLQFEGAAPPIDVDARNRRELATLDREQARLTEAVAAGGDMPILLTRLRETERRRIDLLSAQTPSRRRPEASWGEIEHRMRERLANFRSLLTGGTVAQARQFLRLLPEPIKFTPYVDRGYRAIKFEGRFALNAFFGGEVVMNVASPTGFVVGWEFAVQRRRCVASAVRRTPSAASGRRPCRFA